VIVALVIVEVSERRFVMYELVVVALVVVEFVVVVFGMVRRPEPKVMG